MSRPTIEPVTDATLHEFSTFLHRHLSPDVSPNQWAERLQTPWANEHPNYGFVLRDQGAIVGGIGAIYAERNIRGRQEKFCNITSWCVLDAYRQQSMRLAMTVIGQTGYHFTDFSPTKVVGGTLQFFKFRPLDERQAVLLNLPWLSRGTKLLHRSTDIDTALDGEQRQIYRDHAVFPWLCHVLVGCPGDWCHVIYKPRKLKGLPAAGVVYMSNGKSFVRHFRRLGAHLLARGYLTTLVECRSLPAIPKPSTIRSGFNPKLFLSASLQHADIDYLYSESVALDL